MSNELQVTLADVQTAYERVKPYIIRTPLVEIEPHVFLKAEHKQVVKSFKPRGAGNAVLLLSDDERQRGVVARSSGNFAQGLSYICKELDVPATIVMSKFAPKVKIETTQSLGANVILIEGSHSDAQALVGRIVDEQGLSKLDPYDHYDVIAGQGTAMLEICEDLSSVDYFFCPIGGGGLLAGCALVLKHFYPDAKVIGVEPEGAGDYYESRSSGTPVRLPQPQSIADGLLAPTVGECCRPFLDAYVDDVMVVSDEEIRCSMDLLHGRGELVEPSGAVAFAGYSRYRGDQAFVGKTVVCVASGGNFDK